MKYPWVPDALWNKKEIEGVEGSGLEIDRRQTCNVLRIRGPAILQGWAPSLGIADSKAGRTLFPRVSRVWG
jgi:hypothetical protein